MRVIAGEAKGRILLGPRGPKAKTIRPALDKVKGAIFNILGEIRGAKVLDLFAGTGSIGIEALSRGASHCLFTDDSREAITLIHQNLARCRFDSRGDVIQMKIPVDLRRLIRRGPFDVIFVDPPYDGRFVNRTLRRLAREKMVAPGGTVVVEHSPREPIDPEVGLEATDQRRYGQTVVSFLKGG